MDMTKHLGRTVTVVLNNGQMKYFKGMIVKEDMCIGIDEEGHNVEISKSEINHIIDRAGVIHG